ncbi:BTAD domain-containing putative transcriptional regulator [Mycobacterium bourgelatii]|nr:BTAD domain-containing putative transcriptional regulator [Mycobacterium bourgelatii]MCV6974856.1 FHA domain-containing protein [Mycobacterium bourgelatii]
MTNTALGFGVLGPLQMISNGALVPLGPAKQRAVLAVLLMNRNRPVSVETLINAVWGDEPVPAARTSIQSHISNLRRLLREAGVDPVRVLASAPPGYQLSVPDTNCDHGRFSLEKRAGIEAAAQGRYEEASRHLSAALAEWRGPVLDDLRDLAFVDAVNTALMEEKVAVHTARAEAEIACGRAGAVIGELETLTAEHPFREPLWAQLITAYYVTERQSDALNAYRRLKMALAEGLGIDPGPTINALHERILRQERLGTLRPDLKTRRRSVFREELPTLGMPRSVIATLTDTAGRRHKLTGATTRIGRLADNDVVIEDTDVSRYHAVISDTGTEYVITDLRSTNGVEVEGRLITGSAPLSHGDRISICGYQFTFELRAVD